MSYFINKDVTLFLCELNYLDLLFGKHCKDSCIVLCIIDPLDCNSDKVSSLSVRFEDLWISIDSFGSPETGVITLGQEVHLTIGFNFTDLKDNRRVFILRIIEHPVEFLYESQVNLLVFLEFKSKIPGLILFRLDRNEWVIIL